MSRRDEDDRDFSPPRAKPPRGGWAPGVWVMLAGVGGAMAGLVVGIGIGAWAGAQRGADRPAAGQTATAPKPAKYTRDEFRKLVDGKTMQEVLDAVGTPNSRDNEDNLEPRWFYLSPCYDPLTNHVDRSVTIHFQSGRVRLVVF